MRTKMDASIHFVRMQLEQALPTQAYEGFPSIITALGFY